MDKQLKQHKIFMFSSVHFWQDTRIFFKEAKSLSNNGWDVSFFAVGQNEGYEQIEDHNLTICLLPRNKSKFRFHQWFFLYKKALESDAKYYHFHDPELLLVSWLIKKKKPDVITIYDMHENFPKQIRTKSWIPKLLRLPLSIFIKSTEKIFLNSCDQIIFAETSYKEDYQGLAVNTIDILNYPLHVEDDSSEKTTMMPTLIYVGDITEDRNIFGMIEVIHRVVNKFGCMCCLKLIGPIEAKLKRKVDQLINDYQLSHLVHWYGRIPYDEIWPHYYQADIGLCLLHPIPNYQNSLATKLFEYMAARLPIVASNFPDWEELVHESNCGITIDPLDHNQTAVEIVRLLNNPELLKRHGNSGRKAFEKQFNWSSEEKKLLSIYDQRKYLDGKC